MALPQQFLEALRANLAVSQIVGRRVKLTRRGREYVGLCPFHRERTPSFHVVPDGAFYHWDADQDAYVVVDPPDGSEVPWVPDGYTIADRDGILYYVYGGVYYRPVLRRGKRVYVVNRRIEDDRG